MKQKLILWALAAMMLLCVCGEAAAEANNKPILYNGNVTRRYGTSTTSIYPEMDKESKPFKYLNPGAKIQITAIYPNWVEVNYNGQLGYIIRQRIDIPEDGAVDPLHTPAYPVDVQYFYAVIDRDVNVMSDKSPDSEILSTLTAGARVAITGMEDGWAKLIYHRQYGYIDTNDLPEIYPVQQDPAVADSEAPMAVFTSFYNDNPDRINNLAVACAYISKVMQPGEEMNFNETVGPFNAARGYLPAPVLVDETLKNNYGGGSCQVSSTLWDTLIQLTGITTVKREPHGNNGANYLPHGMDASSGTDWSNLIFRNDYDFPIRIDASVHDFAMFVAVYRER